eukprot:GHVS01057088.1.p1 GENE.GHVS01057088.1~~GHVS01057088.1.p1  ORF type:complete len:905 (+),score=185.28 GHVS01057088.1:125-2716(+)
MSVAPSPPPSPIPPDVVSPEVPSSLILSALGSCHDVAVCSLHKLSRLWSPSVLMNEGVVDKVAVMLKDPTTVSSVTAAGWGLLHRVVSEDSEDDVDEAADMRLKQQEINKPITCSKQVAAVRACVMTHWGMDSLCSEIRRLVRLGITDQPTTTTTTTTTTPTPTTSTSGVAAPSSVSVCSSLVSASSTAADAKIERCRAVLCLLGVARHIGNMDESAFYDLVEVGLSCVGSRQIPRAAAHALGHVADQRRRMGVKIKAIRCSQGIVKCIASLSALLENREDENLVSAVLSVVLFLLGDKDRNAENTVDMDLIADNLLDGYLMDTNNASAWCTGLLCWQCLWSGSRDTAKTYIDRKQLLICLVKYAADRQPDSPELQKHSVLALMNVMQFAEIRTQIVQNGGMDVLVDLCNSLADVHMRCRLCAALAQLCVHDEEVKDKLFCVCDFFRILRGALTEVEFSANATEQEKETAEALLQILFFLSMHGDFKSSLLNPSSLKLIKSFYQLGAAAASGEPMTKFLYASVVYNLVRSRDDKDTAERASNKKSGVQLDESQIAELENLYEKLPPEAKPAANGVVDLGTKETADQLRVLLVDQDIVARLSLLACQPSASRNLIVNACKTMRLICCTPSLRGKVIAQGGLKALLLAVQGKDDDDEKRHLRQAIAQLCISTNPSLFAYHEALDIVPHLIHLLKDRYELYQYEAALGLTNLTSLNDDIRTRAWHGGAWEEFGQLLFSDNDMLRSAGIEGWCNLAQLPLAMETFGNGKNATDLKLLFAFCAEDDNTRAQSAATGALATLSLHENVPEKLCAVPNFDNLRDLYRRTSDTQLIVRCEACMTNIMECESAPSDIKQQLRAAIAVRSTTT